MPEEVKYPEGDIRNGPCEEHINAALFKHQPKTKKTRTKKNP